MKLIDMELSDTAEVEHERKILTMLGLHRHIVCLADSFDPPGGKCAFVMELRRGRRGVRQDREGWAVQRGRRRRRGAAGRARPRLHPHGRCRPPRPKARELTPDRRRRHQARRLWPRRMVRQGRQADHRDRGHGRLHGAGSRPRRRRRRPAIHADGRPLLPRLRTLLPTRRVPRLRSGQQGRLGGDDGARREESVVLQRVRRPLEGRVGRCQGVDTRAARTQPRGCASRRIGF